MRNILLCYFYISLRQQEMKKSLLQCTKSKNMPQAIQLDKKFLSLADKEIVNHDFFVPAQNVTKRLNGRIML